jgi:hypothetical protein
VKCVDERKNLIGIPRRKSEWQRCTRTLTCSHGTVLMADTSSSDYNHRSIEQIYSINECVSSQVLKQYCIVETDSTAKQARNNNNNLIGNRNTRLNSINNHQSSELKEHQTLPNYCSSSSTPQTPLSITEAQMNDAKVK